ncbi:MAG: hypothetical protein ACRDIL_21515 [Candidatus Limnocylindrales bacterium]
MAEPGHDGNDTRLGRLRTYLGTAPGVGKTYAMLNDGWRRSEGGERVVVGWIERHGRAETQAQLRNLEVVPKRSVDYRGSRFDELDVAAVMARQPDVVLIDELAHTHVDGARKRWEDAAELVAAGLSVMTTVNLANLVSARDFAARVTGVGTVESVPDDFVRSGEVVLIDPSPEALRRRIAAGNVYTADTVGGAPRQLFPHVQPCRARRARTGLDGGNARRGWPHRARPRGGGAARAPPDGARRRVGLRVGRARDPQRDRPGARGRCRPACCPCERRRRPRSAGLNELVRGSVASRMRRLVRESALDEVHGQR